MKPPQSEPKPNVRLAFWRSQLTVPTRSRQFIANPSQFFDGDRLKDRALATLQIARAVGLSRAGTQDGGAL